MKKKALLLLLAIITLQIVYLVHAWEIERPWYDIDIKGRTESAYTNGEASVGLGAGIRKYYENDPHYDADFVMLNVSMTANSRKGMTYAYSWQSLWWIPENELWYRSDWVGAGDDAVIPVNIPQNEGYFAFRFYGGLGSAEYQKIYASTNGFISFHNSTQPSPSPLNIPSSAEPNAVIAATWTDLNIDSSASIITGLGAMFGRWYFVIIWNNALHKASGQRLTFQIILENAPQYYPANSRYSQSQIWISYKSVGSINTDFAFGMEDQMGDKGLGGLCSGNSLGNFNGATYRFFQYSNNFFLKKLTISFQDNSIQTEFNIWEDDNGYYLRGTNIQWDSINPSQPDGTYMFAKALGGTATLLISAFSPWGWLTAAGLIVDTVLVSSDWVDYLAYRQYSGRQVTVRDREDGLQQQANASALTYDYAVDASLSLMVDWILKTPNNIGHSLTITASLEYYEYSITDGSIINKPPITTSVSVRINPDDNNSFDTARVIGSGTYSRVYLGGSDTEDFYKVNVPTGYVISVAMDPPSDADFDLYLYRPDRTLEDSSTNRMEGIYEEVDGIASSSSLSGYWFIKMQKFTGQGFYSFTVSVSYYSSGDGGGCPFVSTWDGNKYHLDNNLLPASESLGGADVRDYYLLEQMLAQREDGTYALLLSEFENEHDFFDKVQLLAVDHPSNVSVAVSPQGEILTYTNPSPPVLALDDKNRNVKSLLNSIDGNYYEGYNGSYITLNFGDLDVSHGAKLVLRADYSKMSIHIQVQDSKGSWNTVASVIPRINWATEIIDMSKYLPDAKGNLKVRLYFTKTHKLDFVGLDTSPQTTIEAQQGQLLSAMHSEKGDVAHLLLYSDQTYAKLVPGQQIELLFTLPPQTMEKRDFIIIAEGHYFYFP